MSDYVAFLENKRQLSGQYGFAPVWMPDFLFGFQQALVEWALVKGRAAIFADCGLGKTPMQLVWADNVVRRTNRPVLIATPLAVSYQVQREAAKFGIETTRSVDGRIPPGARIVVTNYERLDRFTASDFVGLVCDESSILKNFDGTRRKLVQEFMRTLPYRLLCTATAAPNDYVEIGTSSEALGELGHLDMLARFFKNIANTSNPRIGWRSQGGVERTKWRFRGHAEEPFWRWVASWARALRRPSDLGYPDAQFQLPPLHEHEHIVEARTTRDGMLFNLPAIGLKEEREERRRTLEERCEMVGTLVRHDDPALVWCQLNDEGDRLAEMIPDAVQVAGKDSDDQKEETLRAFADGELRVLITKPKIGAFGLNLQRCAHVTFFPSHSYEQYYQGVRRCWRFGQERPVRVDIIGTEGERAVLRNLKRKAAQAEQMFAALVRHMGDALTVSREDRLMQTAQVPTWL
jgi:hypothetical protein